MPVDPTTAPHPRVRVQDLGMLLVTAIWGTNFSVTKLALREIPPLPFTALRFAVASALLWAVLRWREGRGPALPAPAWVRLVWVGVVGNTLYQLGFILGLDRTTATNSSLILASMPTVVAVLAGALGIERITSRMRWGLALATLGVVLVVASRGVGFSTETLAGDLLTAGAVLCWATYTLGLRGLPPGLSSLRITTLTMLTGTPGLLALGLPGLLGLDWSAVSPGAWLGLAYATILSLVLAYFLWTSSVRVVGGSRTAIYMCITPMVAVFMAWLLLGERPAVTQLVGAVGIIAGVLVSRMDRRGVVAGRRSQVAGRRSQVVGRGRSEPGRRS